MANELPFKVVRMSKLNEVLVYDTNLLIARAAYGLAVELLPSDRIELRHGARIVEKSQPS